MFGFGNDTMEDFVDLGFQCIKKCYGLRLLMIVYIVLVNTFAANLLCAFISCLVGDFASAAGISNINYRGCQIVAL
jgi:hypothetical protein